MIAIPLSVSGPADAFAARLEAHRAALAAHRLLPAHKAGAPAPADPILDALVLRVPDTGPVAKRKPDTFAIAPYTIVDDTPRTAEAQKAIETLRETLSPK